MCTVTFIPLRDKFFFAHNRDEESSRLTASPPKEYLVNGHALCFPKDGQAGGSWIACNKNGHAAVLLNGAFEKHVRQTGYRKSRGLIFLDIVAAHDSCLSYCNIDLNGIEPFTVILWNDKKLYECRWNGKQKHISQLAASKAHIWSSVTLYDALTLSTREEWVYNWLQLHPYPSMDDIIQFHLSAGDGDTQYELRMNRNGTIRTVSVTVLEISRNGSLIQYLDLQHQTRSVHEFPFTKAAAVQ